MMVIKMGLLLFLKIMKIAMPSCKDLLFKMVMDILQTLMEMGLFTTYGGGIYCQDSDPTLKDLIITNNSGDEGGGGGIFLYEASPTIIGCFITNNSTDDVGGGLYARFSNVSIINTKFIANEADLGSGCYLRNESIPTMTNVDFISNVAANSGGGVLLKDNADAVMYNVKIVNNLAEGLGGGLYVNNADQILILHLLH